MTVEPNKLNDSNQFLKLYFKESIEELITPLQDAVGFSLVRNYKPDTEYFKDNKKLFLKFYLSKDNFVVGSVNLVSSKPNQVDSFTIENGDKYKKKITNFDFNVEDGFLFDWTKKKIVHIKSKKEFSVNDFVDVLVKNHLTDKFRIKRKLSRVVGWIIQILFWLSDNKYSEVKLFLTSLSTKTSTDVPLKKDLVRPDPLLKYFAISKNLLLVFCIFLFTLLSFLRNSCWSDKFDFSLSNPLVPLAIFVLLFLLEKICFHICDQIDFLLKNKDSWMLRLHKYRYQNSFSMKF